MNQAFQDKNHDKKGQTCDVMAVFHSYNVVAFQCGGVWRQQKEIESQPEAILSLKRPHNGQFR